MKKFLCLLALLVAVTFMPSSLKAQDSGNSGGGQDNSANAASSTTVTGCLKSGKQAGHYMLMAADGTTYHLRSRQVKLEEHVGHTVEVTGRIPQGHGNAPGAQSPSASSSAKSSNNDSESTTTPEGQNGLSGANGSTGAQNGQGGHSGHMLIVTSVKMVSDTCKSQ
jgi:hypothetical protein